MSILADLTEIKGTRRTNRSCIYGAWLELQTKADQKALAEAFDTTQRALFHQVCVKNGYTGGRSAALRHYRQECICVDQ